MLRVTKHGGEVEKKQGGAGSESKHKSSAKGLKTDGSGCVSINEPKQSSGSVGHEVTDSGMCTCNCVSQHVLYLNPQLYWIMSCMSHIM